MRIGNVDIKTNVALGPMAGVTDLPFRLLCKEQGCGLLYTEMVSAKAVLYNNKNTEELLKTDKKESPIAVQLFGSEPQIMADIAKRLAERDFDIIDVNMGCPVPKVVNNGEGSALLKNPLLVGNIVEAMANAVDKPVTVKIRTGFDETCINAEEIAYIIQDLSLLVDKYNKLLINKDRTVRAIYEKEELIATAIGINKEGELIVKDEAGKEIAIRAGEVSVRGLYGYV